MKLFKIITTTILASIMGAGVFGVVAANKDANKVEVTKAETTSVTLAGSFNDWSTTANPLTLDGDYWSIVITLKANDEFKIVVNGSDWVGDGDGIAWCNGLGSLGKGQNFQVLSNGRYQINAAKNIGDYGDKSAGIVFKQAYKITRYALYYRDGDEYMGDLDPEWYYKNINDVPLYTPTNVYQEGYMFEGWYKNSDCKVPWEAEEIYYDISSIWAKYTQYSWAGTVHVDLRDTWYDASANYAILFMDKTTYSEEVTGWSTYVTGTAAGVRLVDIPYNLPFEPKEMTLVRYNSAYTSSQWNTKKFPTDGNLWGQTPDLSYDEVIRVGTTTVDGKNLAYLGYPKVMMWNPSSEIYLDSVKLNGRNHAEYYSTTVSLAVNQEFKTVIAPYASGDYYGNYTTHESIKNNFSDGGASNIKCLVAGTYAFYFDSVENNTYITKVGIAEADEWAQSFLSGVTCSGSGTISKDGWTTLSGTYGLLCDEAKAIFIAVSEGGDAEGSFVEKAIARYDFIIKKYGTTSHPDFMGRITAGKLHPRAPIYIHILGNNTNNTSIIVGIIVSIVALSAVGGYFYLRKRKQK